MRTLLPVLLCAACGNDLPGLGTCDVTADGTPELVDVSLGAPAGFDDLRFSPQLRKVIAAPEGTGRLYLIEPDTLDLQIVPVPGGTASADANATTIFALDRGNGRILALDAKTFEQVAVHDVAGADYIRVAPDAPEVWATIPGRDRISIFDSATLAPLDMVELPCSTEGLTFDGGRAYTQCNGGAVVIDVARRTVLAELDAGCTVSHGFPQVDRAYDLVFAGCHSNGGVGVLSGGGARRSGIEAGGDAAILAYDPTRHHLYVRGDPGTKLDIVGVCRDGGMAILAEVAISTNGHGATVDDRGHVWVCNANTGGVQRISDPFAATN